jgi:hypothetical protein
MGSMYLPGYTASYGMHWTDVAQDRDQWRALVAAQLVAPQEGLSS